MVYLIFALWVGMLQFQELPADRENYEILYFYTPDCPSCLEVAPFIEHLKEEYEIPVYSFNMRNPAGFRFGVKHNARYVPLLIIQITKGDETEYIRFENIDEIKESEPRIAELNKKKNKNHR